MVGKDATPNAYRTRVFSTTEDGPGSMSLGTDIGITVRPQNDTAKKLQNTSIFDSGVTPISVNVKNTNFTVNYNVEGAKVLGIKQDGQSKEVIVSLQAVDDGKLIIDLPRELIDAKIHQNMDDTFIVLGDGQEIKYKEIHKSISYRTLSIPFPQGISKIEIIGVSQI